jgi:hypothetical protein
MNKDENNNDYEKDWSLTIGFYPGVLFGLRTYNEPGYVTWVLYLPFVDIALEIDI